MKKLLLTLLMLLVAAPSMIDAKCSSCCGDKEKKECGCFKHCDGKEAKEGCLCGEKKDKKEKKAKKQKKTSKKTAKKVTETKKEA